MKNFELTNEESQALKAVHRKTKERYAADRIKVIVLLGSGWTLEEVSEALLLDSETLRNYLSTFKKGGVEALLERHYKGGPAKLTIEQLTSLKQHLQEVTYLAVAAIVAYVKKTYSVVYSISGMTELMHRLGFVHKKPDIAPGRVDVAKQLEFLQKFEKLRRSGHPVYSLDGCHPQHNSMPQYGWILKGHTKTLPSNSGRKRINIQGAVNLDTHALISTVHETLDKYSTIEILKKVEKKHTDSDKIYILVDNAGYYHADEVKKHLKNSRIELVFLPPYAPHLSLIERVWRHLKKAVLYNQYYPAYQEFKESISNYLGRSHKKAFKKLLVEKFHFAQPQTSMLQLAA
jgi:transposase